MASWSEPRRCTCRRHSINIFCGRHGTFSHLGLKPLRLKTATPPREKATA